MESMCRQREGDIQEHEQQHGYADTYRYNYADASFPIHDTPQTEARFPGLRLTFNKSSFAFR